MKKTPLSIRIKAIALACIFMLQLCTPTITFALTGGPSQPEVESFEPVSTNQMVDSFTGDFTYNLPLLNVPGPNGGYPINIAYHAGVTMDQEASWVGLGWNINPGVINRNLRGLPDDFNGDVIKYELSMRPHRSIGLMGGIGINPELEVFGAEFTAGFAGSLSFNPYYNNYRGIGADWNVGLNYIFAYNNELKPSTKKETDGPPEEKVTTITETENKMQHRFSIGTTINSKQGMGDISMSYMRKQYSRDTYNSEYNGMYHSEVGNIVSGRSRSGKISFGTIPATSFRGQSLNSKNFRINATFGTQPGAALQFIMAGGYYSDRTLTQNGQSQNNKSYGYLYSQNVNWESTDEMDFFMEKDMPVSKRTPNIAIPVSNFDLFMINGEGVGGMFRAYRSDIGKYREGHVRGHSETFNLNPEFQSLPGASVGITAEGGYGQSNFGALSNGSGNELQSYDFDQRSGLFEPFYFKLVGEYSSENDGFYDDNHRSEPVSFDAYLTEENARLRPAFKNKLNEYSTLLDSKRNERKSRNQSIQYTTVDEIINGPIPESNDAFIANPVGSSAPGEWDNTMRPFDYSQIGISQIGKIDVLTPDGRSYTYGLPAPNLEQRDAVFSIEPELSNNMDNPANVEYLNTESSTGNTSGYDNYFSRKTTPAYSHSYLLTKIVSPDYIDLTNDGPTPDDLGDYVKFNYSEIADVNWRFPYSGVNYSKGEFSDPKDDKGSYSWGKKNVYYLHSIETKTHTAYFLLEQRSDNYGAKNIEDEYTHSGLSIAGRKPSFKLTRIELKLNDLDRTLVQAVEFRYDYALCKAIPNYFDNTSNENFLVESAQTGGKLTLREIIFEYGENKKGRLNPYHFEYNESYVIDDDPYESYETIYNPLNVNRWGQFERHDDIGEEVNNYAINENPYVSQYNKEFVNDPDYFSDAERVGFASAWNLKQITLPSGARIDVEYELDDYAYVQDKTAMQMMRIVGTSEEGEDDNNNGIGDLGKTFRRIYFQLEKPYSGPDDSEAEDICVQQYLKDKNGNWIDDLYFKVWTNMKVQGEGMAKDYVEGYARFKKDSESMGISSSNDNYGYITLEKSMAFEELNLPVSTSHPFRFAALQFMRTQRTDLLNIDSFDGVEANFITIQNSLENLLGFLPLIVGFYNQAAIMNWCSSLDLTGKPSLIRLNCPDGRKFGGGHRVSKVTVSGSWYEDNGGQTSYSTTYKYKLADGSSSGVAENEPAIGGEENPLRQPIWYNGSENTISLRSPNSFTETPYCESYMPAPGVGYSRIVIQAQAQDYTADEAKAAQIVEEFYTAKDFPVIVKNPTKLEKVRLNFSIPLIVIGGSIDINNNGYSQGFSIELNDMHGKPKSRNVYKNYLDLFPGDLSIQLPTPSESVSYEYFTSDENPHQLKNELPVLLNDDGDQEIRTLGVDFDFYMAERESQSWDISGGVDANLTFTPFAIPSAFPQASYGEIFTRSVATTKMTFRTGILKRITNRKDGSYASSENLLFDPITGNALLVKTENEFGKSLYTLSTPAYWNYEGMGPAFQNIRAMLTGSQIGISNGQLTWDSGVDPTDFSLFFTPGDQLQVSPGGGEDYQYLWVNTVSENSVSLMNEDGATNVNYPNLALVEIIRSGYKNQQSEIAGTIVSLTNLFGTSELPTFPGAMKNFFQQEAVCPGDSWQYFLFQTCDGKIHECGLKIDCFEGKFNLNGVTIDGVTTGNGNMLLTGIFADELQYDDLSININEDGTVLVNVINDDLVDVHDITLLFQGVSLSILNPECIDAVLQAGAVEYSNGPWNYNYEEGYSAIENESNLFRYGKMGIWRPVRNFTYQVDRLQGDHQSEGLGTNTSEDGVFKHFTKFKWTNDIEEENVNWDWIAQATLFDPLGNMLEERNALDIYGSELLGYSNRLVTAVAGNARYHEIAYESFEDLAEVTENHGHFSYPNAPQIEEAFSHTGKKSLEIPTGESTLYTIKGHGEQSNLGEFVALNGQKKYLLSCWIFAPEGNDVELKLCSENCAQTVSVSLENIKPIDGWYRVELVSDFPDASLEALELISVNNSGGVIYLDDIRLAPFESKLVSYVYDPIRYRLVALLDDNNYATFYTYDMQGSLIQTKQETERGVVTTSTNQSNIQH
jgi:hypothetical protein